MKAIQTSFGGYRFRSRTEARWAVFFDRIGLRWEYEEQGYILSDGTPYLPDFKLLLPRDIIAYCEVKPEEFDDFSAEELGKLRLLADDLSCNVLLLTGSPAYRVYQQILPNTPPNTLTHASFQDSEPFVRILEDRWLAKMSFDENTGRMHFIMDEMALADAFGPGYVQAVTDARSARFERGETPKRGPADVRSSRVRNDGTTSTQNPRCYRCAREISERDVVIFSKPSSTPIKTNAPTGSYGIVRGALVFSFCVSCAKKVPIIRGISQVNA